AYACCITLGLTLPSPPPAPESWTLPRPSDPASPPWLLTPSSPPSPIGPPAPPGSLVPPAPPWSVFNLPSPQDSTSPAVPRRSVPLAPLGSSLPPALPQSSEMLRLCHGILDLRLSRLSLGFCLGPPDPRASPPLAPPPSDSLLESSALLHYGTWVSPGSSCSLLSPPWLLPPSDSPWTLPSPPWLLPSSSPPWILFVVLLLGVCPLPEPPPALTMAQGCVFREGGVL
ncbi:hypothetical protein M9458_048976, partial [Cirrhinus mrigala]